MNSLPSTWLTQVPELTRVRAWGLSYWVKAVKGGGSHSNPPDISCWGMWEQGPAPPGCCRMGWGQSCVGATELVVPPSSFPACPRPADTLSRAPEAWKLFLQSPCGTLELNCCQKGDRGLEQSQNHSGTAHLSHFHPGKAWKSKP